MLNWLLRLFQRIQPECQHEFDYMNEMTGRNSEGMVSCRCDKCGELFRAECGLDLPGKLIQKRKTN